MRGLIVEVEVVNEIKLIRLDRLSPVNELGQPVWLRLFLLGFLDDGLVRGMMLLCDDLRHQRLLLDSDGGMMIVVHVKLEGHRSSMVRVEEGVFVVIVGWRVHENVIEDPSDTVHRSMDIVLGQDDIIELHDYRISLLLFLLLPQSELQLCSDVESVTKLSLRLFGELQLQEPFGEGFLLEVNSHVFHLGQHEILVRSEDLRLILLWETLAAYVGRAKDGLEDLVLLVLIELLETLAHLLLSKQSRLLTV